jgi:cell division protein ZapA (FtsZ GTPase activity inhibitor)
MAAVNVVCCLSQVDRSIGLNGVVVACHYLVTNARKVDHSNEQTLTKRTLEGGGTCRAR